MSEELTPMNYFVLQEYAQKHRLDLNELSRVAREAVTSGCPQHVATARMADIDQLLRAVFEVCEATENIEPKNDFERGRVFEAKHIRRGVGTWFQDTFCGRTHMGEPAPIADNERIAQRATEIAEELRRALPPNTDFGDGWQQRYMDRQNERFETALEMARSESSGKD